RHYPRHLSQLRLARHLHPPARPHHHRLLGRPVHHQRPDRNRHQPPLQRHPGPQRQHHLRLPSLPPRGLHPPLRLHLLLTSRGIPTVARETSCFTAGRLAREDSR